jgi:hypothetical protein
MKTEDFAATYRQMSDEQLEQVIGDLHDLVDDARTALLREFNSRGGTSGKALLIADAGRKRTLPLSLTEGVNLELTAKFGTVEFAEDRYFLKAGLMFFGKDNRTCDKTYDYEEFDTEIYRRIFFSFPAFPRGCFRVRTRGQSGPEGSEFAILRKI